jgi:hypothetical protein
VLPFIILKIMAEETVKVPEAVVIPYGQESIDYNKFLTNAADSV